MRNLVDIPDYQIEELQAISAARNVSRAEVIREAIAIYSSTRTAPPEQAFGLWGNRQADGLDYQDEVRSEW